jgi:hydroxymethylbilane synthase
MKDMPMLLPPGLSLPVMIKRQAVEDAFISKRYAAFALLPKGAVIGTSSLRRQSQLRALRPDLNCVDLRGNIHTRLKRLDADEYAAIILAAAGLKRMGLDARIRHTFSTEEVLPAAGQGALGLECKEQDQELLAMLAPLNDFNTYTAVQAERLVCLHLGGNCQVPVAALAQLHHNQLQIQGLVANRDGTQILRANACGNLQEGAKLARIVADALLAQGAEQILKTILQKEPGNKT